jgi:hypothetical protein
MPITINVVGPNHDHGEVTVCQFFAVGRWFSLVSTINTADRHDMSEILLKVVLNTITLTESHPRIEFIVHNSSHPRIEFIFHNSSHPRIEFIFHNSSHPRIEFIFHNSWHPRIEFIFHNSYAVRSSLQFFYSYFLQSHRFLTT